MSGYYSDSFGFTSTSDVDYNPDFHRYVSRVSVRKVCKGCGETVRLLPDYSYCHSCGDIIERGGELPNPTSGDRVVRRVEVVDWTEYRRHLSDRKVHRTESDRLKMVKRKWDEELTRRRMGTVSRPQTRRRPMGGEG